MKTIIIGAQIPEGTLINKYRHQMLGKALERCQLEGATAGLGVSGGFKENIWVLTSMTGWTTEEWDMIGTLAIAFEQDYFLYIENDLCYQVDPLTLSRVYRGIWWRVGKGTPSPVMEAIIKGTSGKEGGAYSYYNGRYYGLHKAEDLGENYAYELAAGPYMHGNKLEADAHKARTYPY